MFDAYGVSEEELNLRISINIRTCVTGEEERDEQCIFCPEGKYTFLSGADECEICHEKATCPGGFRMRINEGYWRDNIFSNEIFECPLKEACTGDDGSTDLIEQP